MTFWILMSLGEGVSVSYCCVTNKSKRVAAWDNGHLVMCLTELNWASSCICSHLLGSWRLAGLDNGSWCCVVFPTAGWLRVAYRMMLGHWISSRSEPGLLRPRPGTSRPSPCLEVTRPPCDPPTKSVPELPVAFPHGLWGIQV
jgi:hypothetical protein